MTNWTELKRLAEEAVIARPDNWYTQDDCCWWTGNADEGDFIAAANPKNVLALIAENERLSEMANRLADDGISISDERDQLRAEVEALRKVSAWAPSDHKYDPAIHHNPDAKAWADLFVSTFPGLAEKHDLMLGWFANAMMAMHDFLEQRDNNDLESMRKYAERYLYLRSCHWNDSPLVVVRNPKQQVKLGAYCPSGNLLDDAIDAEIARTSQ